MQYGVVDVWPAGMGFHSCQVHGCRHEHLVAFSCKRRCWCPCVPVAAQPQWLGWVLGVVIRALSGTLLKRAGVHHCDGASTGMVMFI